MAATTGCCTIGCELMKERFEASKTLLEHFQHVLRHAQITEFERLVTFELCDFFDDKCGDRIKSSSVIFFNNFGKWFNSDNPDKEIGGNNAICSEVMPFQCLIHASSVSMN